MIRAVIFDMDGVLVTTDEFHYRAWARLAEEEGITFDREVNERFRGVSRKDCLQILIRDLGKKYSLQEKEQLLNRKNSNYLSMLGALGPSDILANVTDILAWLREQGLALAVASSSKNAPVILEMIELKDVFDVVVSGNQISRSKPDPEVFLLAADKLGVKPKECLVVEDAAAGIEAAIAARMQVIGVGPAMNHPNAHFGVNELTLEFFQTVAAKL